MRWVNGPRRTAGTAVWAAAMLIGLGTAQASANWQYTEWGMSLAQVKAASDKAATDNPDRRLDADGLTAALVAPYKGATLDLQAVFLFDEAGGLKVVTLNPRDHGSCPAIIKALKDHYGAPLALDKLDKATTARWNDFENNNVVNFLDLGEGDCSIQYSKLPNTRNDGTL